MLCILKHIFFMWGNEKKKWLLPGRRQIIGGNLNPKSTAAGHHLVWGPLPCSLRSPEASHWSGRTLFSLWAQNRNQEAPLRLGTLRKATMEEALPQQVPSACHRLIPLLSEIKAFEREKLLWFPPPPSRCFVHKGMNSTPLSRKEEVIHAQYILPGSLSSISERFSSKNSF